jgi:putative cell wall-binding protein
MGGIMKAGHLLICFSLAFLVASVSAAAEEIEAVVLTTSANYPDTLVAAVAAEKIGAPLLLTDRNALATETKSEIESLGVSSIYIVGGPEVIASTLEDELGENYSITRLWGMTRYGTGVEVATFFWEESAKAVLVWDKLSTPALGNSEMVSQAKELAIDEGAPLMLINKNFIPEQTVSALENLSVQEVILIGNVAGSVTAALGDLGITVAEHIKGDTPNETRGLLKEKLKVRIKAKVANRMKDSLVVVAVGNWEDTVKAPYMPNGTSRHISSADQIDDLIAEINENNFSRIAIVGKPELARIIYDNLTEAGINSTLISGRAAAVATAIVQREKAAIRRRAAAAAATMNRLFAARINTTNLEERSQNIIERAEALLDTLRNVNKTRILDELNRIRDAMLDHIEDGNYTKAWLLYKNVDSRASRLVWTFKTQLVQRYQSMTKRETAVGSSTRS